MDWNQPEGEALGWRDAARRVDRDPSLMPGRVAVGHHDVEALIPQRLVVGRRRLPLPLLANLRQKVVRGRRKFLLLSWRPSRDIHARENHHR